MPRALLAALLLLCGSALAADAAFSVEVPAGKAKSIRLRNLPGGTAMAVRIVATGKLLVALVSAKQIRSPEPDSAAPMFRAVVDRSLTFKVTIPEKGDYFLVLSNRGGSAALSVQAQIRALAPQRKPPAPSAPAKGDKMEKAAADAAAA